MDPSISSSSAVRASGDNCDSVIRDDDDNRRFAVIANVVRSRCTVRGRAGNVEYKRNTRLILDERRSRRGDGSLSFMLTADRIDDFRMV